MREKWDLFGEKCGAHIFEELSQNQASVQDHKEHDYEELTLSGRVMCKVYCRLHKRQFSTKTSQSTDS